MLVEHADVLRGRDGLDQRALDLATGHVARVDDAASAVAALEVQIELGRIRRPGGGQARARLVRVGAPLRAIEMRAVALEHADAVGRLADTELDRTRMAHPCAGHQRVPHVLLERVVLVEHSRDAALGVLRVRLVPGPLRDDDDLSVGGRFERKRQPGDAAADDKEVTRQHGGHHGTAFGASQAPVDTGGPSP